MWRERESYDLATAVSNTLARSPSAPENDGANREEGFESVLNIFESKDYNERCYLLPVSAALLPPAAPWYVEIPYPFAAQRR